MADDGLDGLEDSGSVGNASVKRSGAGSFLPSLLKWIAIALGAIILIVVVVIITNVVMNKNNPSSDNITRISDEYVVQKEILDWYTSLGAIRTKTSDELPASVVVDIALGYKKDDIPHFSISKGNNDFADLPVINHIEINKER